MSEDERGVFDHLPRRRPALRSVRRDRQATARRSWEEEPNEPERESAEARPAEEAEPAFEQGHDGVRDRVEDLILAGVGAAADIVVLGVKLAGRAVPGGRGRDKQ